MINISIDQKGHKEGSKNVTTHRSWESHSRKFATKLEEAGEEVKSRKYHDADERRKAIFWVP